MPLLIQNGGLRTLSGSRSKPTAKQGSTFFTPGLIEHLYLCRPFNIQISHPPSNPGPPRGSQMGFPDVTGGKDVSRHFLRTCPIAVPDTSPIPRTPPQPHRPAPGGVGKP